MRFLLGFSGLVATTAIATAIVRPQSTPPIAAETRVDPAATRRRRRSSSGTSRSTCSCSRANRRRPVRRSSSAGPIAAGRCHHGPGPGARGR